MEIQETLYKLTFKINKVGFYFISAHVLTFNRSIVYFPRKVGKLGINPYRLFFFFLSLSFTLPHGNVDIFFPVGHLSVRSFFRLKKIVEWETTFAKTGEGFSSR